MLLSICIAGFGTGADYPEFRSGISNKVGLDVDFNALYSKANSIYEVVEHDDNHTIWKFSETTGDWAFVNESGYLIVASTAQMTLGVKDRLRDEFSDLASTIRAAGGTISGYDKPFIYYAEDSRVLKELVHNFDSDFLLYLSIPNCTIYDARLSVSGSDYAKVYWGNGNVITYGQWYQIDGKWVLGCDFAWDGSPREGSINCGGISWSNWREMEGFVEVTPIYISDMITSGLHTISAHHIDNKHTMTIEVLTSPSIKPMVLYDKPKTIWIEEIKRSKPLPDLYALI